MRRLFGYFFGLLALSADLWRGPMQGAPLSFASTADYWATWRRSSLIELNAFVEKSLSTGLWDHVLLPALTRPACASAATLAIFFALIGYRRSEARKTMIFPRRRR